MSPRAVVLTSVTATAMAICGPGDFTVQPLGMSAEPHFETVVAAGRRAAVVAACDRRPGRFGLFVTADPLDRPIENGWQATAVHDPASWSVRGMRKQVARLRPRLAGSDTVRSVPSGRTVVVGLARSATPNGLVLDLALPGNNTHEPTRAVRPDAEFLRKASRLACEC